MIKYKHAITMSPSSTLGNNQIEINSFTRRKIVGILNLTIILHMSNLIMYCSAKRR